ncbi:Ubiquitin carboxyl-terminal hydrolase 19 [Sesamum alatum]|uniref:Ubiquitin carboxyl-terminal hydrolase 19 n=1 Tax=Sesamum alatum TaxID=300844 RepID=A0AAE1Y295_9LAMI|nr:Ubiquitin carboxyl-terminal hydrolase 19 [Sesamum alatum]
MHVAVDLNWFLQFIVLVLAAAFGFLYLVRNTASRFFVVDSNFGSTAADFSTDRKSGESMAAAVGGAAEVPDSCAVCGLLTKKQCARCKMVKYCSEACQRSHWNSEHMMKCKDLQSLYKANNTKSTSLLRERKASLVPVGGSSKVLKQSNKILFPYEEFVQFFNWDRPGYPPCGLLNCGNSCFANVVLQCLAYTRPLVAYLLEKGHKKECQMDDWCFLCEFQNHVERASQNLAPFSPINILSRLPNIGGNLGYGKQEDAHEFMRFAIDTMQSVCLDEFGGEKAVQPRYQETTLIQHIFGGRLQSQVICTECNNVSNQFENMMDLTVEIHGDAGSLEECLDQFTAKEWLHGDNMYKCDNCNAYVMAWKRLNVQRAPNILTIALKRFQSGRFGKLNKRVTFPETLDLSSYMSKSDGNDVYKLYAVIVHVDMLNASFFGHYICYVKDFRGNWYRVDDCKVASVDLDEVLSQGAYMLLYSRICARPSCLLPAEMLKKQENGNVKKQEVDPSLEKPVECLSAAGCLDSPVESGHLSSANCSGVEVEFEEEESSIIKAEDASGDVNMVSSEASLPIISVEPHENGSLSISPKEVASPVKQTNQPAPASTSLIDNGYMQPDVHISKPSSPISDVENASQGNKRDAKEGVLRLSPDAATAAENCTFEMGNTIDVIPITTHEVQEVNSANATSMPENVKCGSGSLVPDNDSNDAAVKSNGESPRTKLKPVFVPGFLGKHPRKKSIKQEKKASVELNGTTHEVHLNDQTNQVLKSYLSSENGILWKGEEKPSFALENGKVSTESVALKSLENGDCRQQITSDEGRKTNKTKKRLPVVGQENHVIDNKSHG